MTYGGTGVVTSTDLLVQAVPPSSGPSPPGLNLPHISFDTTVDSTATWLSSMNFNATVDTDSRGAVTVETGVDVGGQQLVVAAMGDVFLELPLPLHRLHPPTRRQRVRQAAHSRICMHAHARHLR